MLTAVRRFPVAGASRLHLYLTAVRFAGHYGGSGVVEKGWSADRAIARQVKTLRASVPARGGVVFPASERAANELPAFAAAIEALAAALPPGLVVVADSGLGYLENLCAADAANVRFVVPLRAGTGWAARFAAGAPGGLAALQMLDHVSHREWHLPPHQRTVWKGLLAPFPVGDRDTGHYDLRAQTLRVGPVFLHNDRPGREHARRPARDLASYVRPTPTTGLQFRHRVVTLAGSLGESLSRSHQALQRRARRRVPLPNRLARRRRGLRYLASRRHWALSLGAACSCHYAGTRRRT